MFGELKPNMEARDSFIEYLCQERWHLWSWHTLQVNSTSLQAHCFWPITQGMFGSFSKREKIWIYFYGRNLDQFFFVPAPIGKREYPFCITPWLRDLTSCENWEKKKHFFTCRRKGMEPTASNLSYFWVAQLKYYFWKTRLWRVFSWMRCLQFKFQV